MNNRENTGIYRINRKKYWQDADESSWNDWRWQIGNIIESGDELSKYFKQVNHAEIKQIEDVYKFGITPYFLSLIDLNNINDPLFRQVIPDIKEMKNAAGLFIDPFDEKNNSPVPGLVKRYGNRVIITASNVCASYCRYCTRKWMWDKKFSLSKKNLNDIIKYLNNAAGINEVILSGGEPFLLPDNELDEILDRIFRIKHVEVVRIGTRILSFLPQRIDDALSLMLSKHKPVWIMTHFNHYNELTRETGIAVNKLMQSGAVLCNQSVLLKGINDDADILKKLFFELVKLRIKPYYLFQCDPVKGSGHFAVDKKKGLKIINDLKKSSSGLCVPHYVEDTKKYGKIELF